ncbi:MAG TPA: cytochrome c biogenesis protein CcdA [Actinomycetota bacterium]|jgi:cytochrome c biogenesis protein CcdA/YHS domain-containing protein|nr:cytochrome c biogenesis protein CcdA [Actinomycetota bacterium]
MNGLVYSASLVAAFLGGVLALFAPCCIVTLLPNFVGASLRRGLVALPMTALLFSAGLSVILLPIVLGVGGLGHLVGGMHGPLFVVVGFLLVLLGIYVLSGRRWMLPVPMLRPGRGGNAATSTFLLGVGSGVMSSCCAPVLAGVVAMSALSANPFGALGLGLAYVFGMVFPLLLFALAAARRGQAPGRRTAPRTIRIGGRDVSWTDAASGAMFLLIGLVTFLVGFSGRESITPGVLAAWDRWATARFADLAAFLGRAPVAAQSAILLTLAAAVAIPLVRAVRRAAAPSRQIDPPRDGRGTVLDPVCGMAVDPVRAAASIEWRGHLNHFCAPGCAKAFEEDPDRFAGSSVTRGQASSRP